MSLRNELETGSVHPGYFAVHCRTILIDNGASAGYVSFQNLLMLGERMVAVP